MILITGATGALGQQTIKHLLKSKDAKEITVLVRNESKARTFIDQGINVKIGSYEDINSLKRATQGIDQLLLIPSPSGTIFSENKNVIDTAKKHGVKHILYTSLLVKNIEKSPLKALLQQHLETEKYAKESGIPFTILKNTMYADAIPLFVGNDVLENGVYLHAADGKVPFALRRELGEAAANTLLDEKHLNKEYELTASEYYTYADVANALSDLSGKQVPFYAETTVEEYENHLRKKGVHAGELFAISGFVTDKRNAVFQLLSNDLEHLLDRKPLSLKESLREIYNF